MTEIELLTTVAAAVGAPLSATECERLVDFAALLRKWNRAFNLVSRKDTDRLVARHLLDALTLVHLLRGPRVLDIGTGAGLPGIPLAIVRPEIEFTLVDRSERRIRFVRQAAIELRLANVRCIEVDFAGFRAERLFDTVVSRAVAKPSELWRTVSRLLAVDGRALFQIGTFNETSFDPSGVSVTIELIDIPGLDQRHRVMRIERQAPTEDADE